MDTDPAAEIKEAEALPPAAAEENQTIEISSDSSDSVDDDMEASHSVSDSDDEVGIIEDESDSDGDSPEEQELEEKFNQLREIPVKEYRQVVQLCEIAFKLNDLEKIELVLGEFEKVAIVPAYIWLKYLRARLVVTQTGEEHKLFEEKCIKALGSYYNVHLAEFVVNYLVEQQKIANATLWANLLSDYGLERPDFLDKLRSLVKTMSEEDEPRAKAIEELMAKQCVNWICAEEEQEVIGSLLEQFRKHIEATKPQYNDSNWSKVHSSFVDKVDALNLKEVVKDNMIKLIFERCVAKFPTVDALWLDYIYFVEDGQEEGEEQQKVKILHGYLKSNALDLARRAVLCRPSVRINHKFLHLMELADYTQAQVDQELALIFGRIQSEMTMTVELHLDYLAYRVRNTNAADEEQANQLRAAFSHVWDELSELYGDQADTSYEVLQLWAQVEYTHLANPTNGSQIWRQIMGYAGSAYRGQLWMGYAQMESEYNGGAGTRAILREAMDQPTMQDAQLVQELYRRYERCYGTYESIAECQMQETPPGWQKSRHKPPPPPPTRRRVPQKNPIKKQPPLQKPTPTIPAQSFKYSPHLEDNKIFIKNLPADCTKEQLTEIFEPYGTIKDVRLVYKFNKQFKGIAYIEFNEPSAARRAVTGGDGRSVGGQNIIVAISNPPPKNFSATATATAPIQTASKRRVPTSLIPTTLVRQEVAAKRRKKLELDNEEQAAEAGESSNGQTGQANGGVESSAADPAPAPKSNDDFRKLFNI